MDKPSDQKEKEGKASESRFPRGNVPTWKLVLEYQGSRYHGWQSQENAKTVQGILELACRDLFKTQVEIGGAGRTDAGVHALHQVAHLRCTRTLPQHTILEGLNYRLPADICILSVQKTDNAFHARHDATLRYYLYQIALRRTAFAKNFVWWVSVPLDFGRISQAVALIPGRHDFACYQDRRMPGEYSTVVKVASAEWDRVGDLLLFRIGASHFLWRMVRRLVGALVHLGQGEFPMESFIESLEGKRFEIAPWTAPSSGLFLERVIYPGEAGPGELRPFIRL